MDNVNLKLVHAFRGRTALLRMFSNIRPFCNMVQYFDEIRLENETQKFFKILMCENET